MESGLFVEFACINRRFTDGKSRFMQDEDGGKIADDTAIESISDSLI